MSALSPTNDVPSGTTMDISDNPLDVNVSFFEKISILWNGVKPFNPIVLISPLHPIFYYVEYSNSLLKQKSSEYMLMKYSKYRCDITTDNSWTAKRQ